MDIGKVVAYEHIHELKVTYPNSMLLTGLVMGIRSASSEQSKAVMRKHMNAQILPRGKQIRQTAELAEQQELESTASCIAWWRWEVGDKVRPGDGAGDLASYKGEQPELSMELAIAILSEVNWLYAQVKEVSINIENFMLGSKSAPPST